MLRYMLEMGLTFLLVNWGQDVEKQGCTQASGPSSWEGGGTIYWAEKQVLRENTKSSIWDTQSLEHLNNIQGEL
jgi:hypothetical protein